MLWPNNNAIFSSCEYSKYCVLCKGRRTVMAAACKSTAALAISSVSGFRMGLVANLTGLMGRQ